jgi:hypothetical protein
MFRANGRALVLLCLLGMLSSARRTTTAQSHAAGDKFAFWYESWKPDVTLKKLQPADVVVGAPASAIPEIHKGGKRVLQYVTYYQSHIPGPFLTDINDIPNVAFRLKGAFLTSVFGKDRYVLCPNSVQLRDRVLSYVDESLKQGYDGYFIDNTFIDPAAHAICDATHEHISRDITGGSSYVQLVAAVRQKLKVAKPDALLIVNPGSPGSLASIAPQGSSLWDLSDYVLWESYGYTSIAGPKHDDWKHTIDQSFAFAAAPDKARKILALSYPRNVEEARFAFAVAQIFGFKWTCNLGENQQDKNEDGGHYGAFLNDVPFDLGEPLGKLPVKDVHLSHREFSHGEIFVNTGDTAQSISIPRNEVLAGSTNGSGHVKTMQLAPMSAAILLRKH